MIQEHDIISKKETLRAPRPVRMADLCCGDGVATRAALAAGMEVVYAYEPGGALNDLYTEETGIIADGAFGRITMEAVPEFDLLMVNLRSAGHLPEVVPGYVLALVKERKPAAIVIEGSTPGARNSNRALRDAIHSLEREGYHVNWRPKIGNDLTEDPISWRSVIIATKEHTTFVWPDEVADDNTEDERPESEHRNGGGDSLFTAFMSAMNDVILGPRVVEVKKQ